MNIKRVIGLIFMMACSLPSLEEEYYDIRPCPDIKPIHLSLEADIAYSYKEKKDIADAANLWSKASCLYKIDVTFSCHRDHDELMSFRKNCLSGGKRWDYNPGTYGCSFRPNALYLIGTNVLWLPQQTKGVLANSCDKASNIQESDLIVCQKEGMCY